MFTLNCKGRLLVLEKPVVMGIINCTPDSFYSGSRVASTDEALAQAEQMLGDGAAILDIGGQSTRPGSERLSAEQELKRVLDPVEAIHRRFPEAFIAIDTYHSQVASLAVAAGASIVNDISAGQLDPLMIDTVAGLRVPYVLMHMQGTPQTMQEQPRYDNVTTNVLDFFSARIRQLRDKGVADIIVDPGFGFGKTIAHNFELLRNLSAFSMLDCPVLVGISRKSTIYKTLGIPAEASLNGTTVLHTASLMNGASILRVHDIKEAVEATRLVAALSGK